MKEFSEDDFLNFVKKKLPLPDARVLVGFGDDSAFYKIPTGKYSCITTDAFVENTHFSLNYFPLYNIGTKSLVSALSDIAAVGGTPSVAVLSLFLRKGIVDTMIDDMYRGIRETAKKYWVNVVGGDTVKAHELALVFTIVGEIDKSQITLRSGAKPGDSICVTGNLGASYIGQMVLEQKMDIDTLGFQKIVNKHLNPEARIDESKKILQHLKVHAMIDISDGLSTDLLHIAQESRVNIYLEANKIPIAEKTLRAAAHFELNAIETALKSGEEYELLFTIPQTEVHKLNTIDIGVRITEIGKITEKGKNNLIAYPDGTTVPLFPTGYNHFE
ncbi:MAG: thiamine-phosphate kinase [Candidatus Cloacimonadota bacterium]|nr:MAG: thiamine-phosphate kinase [Candidatus Cloacimonadota bacterium]